MICINVGAPAALQIAPAQKKSDFVQKAGHFHDLAGRGTSGKKKSGTVPPKAGRLAGLSYSHITFMQKFKCWYQLEDTGIRNNFGPSVQRSFQLGGGGQGAPPGAPHTVHTETTVFPEPIMLLEQLLALKMRNR